MSANIPRHGTPDVLVIGAGIVGAACALTLQREGLRVALLDAGTPGAGVTAAGMGHLVALDDCDDELALCLLSLRLWQQYLDAHPGVGEVSHCGTLWVAEDEEQLAQARLRAERLCRRGWDAVELDPARLAQCEPALRRGLCGAVRVAADSVVYPPAIALFMANQLIGLGGSLHLGQRVVALETGAVTLDTGRRIQAGQIVVAAGAEVGALLDDMPVAGRKGHLAITDRYPGRLRHQVVSMAYGQGPGAGGGHAALTVAANVQPRPTGQWLVGSSRQDGQADTSVDMGALGQVLRAAITLLPCLSEMRVVRAWTGMRPATPDGKPLIGAHPTRPGIWLAAGHEGLGVTTAPGTARLLADQMLGRASEIDAAPYAPARFAPQPSVAYA
ncbi:MAG: FAD-dependent oxidoreductase [Pseudomonadota bacterium]